MPLSAFIADSAFPYISRRFASGDGKTLVVQYLHGAAPRACMTAPEPFDFAFDLAPQCPAGSARSTIRVEARLG
jgi:hypothetical protein